LKYEKTMIKTVQVYLTYSFKIGKYFETWIYWYLEWTYEGEQWMKVNKNSLIWKQWFFLSIS